jgi:hypothetical protein
MLSIYEDDRISEVTHAIVESHMEALKIHIPVSVEVGINGHTDVCVSGISRSFDSDEMATIFNECNITSITMDANINFKGDGFMDFVINFVDAQVTIHQLDAQYAQDEDYIDGLIAKALQDESFKMVKITGNRKRVKELLDRSKELEEKYKVLRNRYKSKMKKAMTAA